MTETAEEQAEEGADNEQWTLQSRRTNKRKNDMELNQREHDKSSNNNNNNNNQHETKDEETEDHQQELTGILKKSNHQIKSQHRVLIIENL